MCTVHRDLSLLQTALKRIDPAIEADIAPDRDAIVLTGTVPDVTYLRAAEAAAQNYLDAAQGGPANRLLLRDDNPAQQPGTPNAPGAPANPPAPAQTLADFLRV